MPIRKSNLLASGRLRAARRARLWLVVVFFVVSSGGLWRLVLCRTFKRTLSGSFWSDGLLWCFADGASEEVDEGLAAVLGGKTVAREELDDAGLGDGLLVGSEPELGDQLFGVSMLMVELQPFATVSLNGAGVLLGWARSRSLGRLVIALAALHDGLLRLPLNGRAVPGGGDGVVARDIAREYLSPGT